MELKDLVCGIRYAKTLKKYGIDQTKSFAVFYGIPPGGKPVPYSEIKGKYISRAIGPSEELISEKNIISENQIDRNKKESQKYFTSTFTTEELLEILPKEIKHNHNSHSSYYLCMGFNGEHGLPLVWYEDNDLDGKEEILVSKSDKKMVNALAHVLIWLLAKKKIKLFDGDVIEKRKKIEKLPKERTIFHRVPKRFYSFKHKCWVLITKSYTERGSSMVWRDFINEETGEKMDEAGEQNDAKLSRRILSHINNPKLF